MPFYKTIAVLVAVKFFVFLPSCAPEPEAEITAYGDSVTWGFGALPGGWVSRLQTKTGFTFSNLGVPGETAEGGAKRIVRAMASVPNSSVVLLIHGGNDWVGIFRGDPCKSNCDPATEDEAYENVARHLRRMRNRIKDEDKKVIFGQYWPTSPEKCDRYETENFIKYQQHRDYLNAKIQAVADEQGDFVVTHGDMSDMPASKNFYDCLHPSASGYDLITDRWLQDFDQWKPESKWMFEF